MEKILFSSPVLLNSNRLCQVSRLIHIQSFAHRYIVGKQLKGNDCQRIRKEPVCFRDIDHTVRRLLNVHVIIICHCQHISASRLHLNDVADGFLVQILLGDNRGNQRSLLNQGNGSVL